MIRITGHFFPDLRIRDRKTAEFHRGLEVLSFSLMKSTRNELPLLGLRILLEPPCSQFPLVLGFATTIMSAEAFKRSTPLD